MNIKLLKLTFTIILFLGVATLSPANINAKSSIGVSPGTIENDVLLPGSSFETQVVISRGEASKSATAKIEIADKSDKIKDWISFSPGTEVPLPSGEQRTTITVKISVPSDAALGDYTGAFNITLVESETEGQVVVLAGTQVGINLRVINVEYHALEVKLSNIQNVHKGEDLKLTLKIANNGNAADAPTKVTLDFENLLRNPVTSVESSEIPDVASFNTENVDVPFDVSSLDLGEYYAIIKVYDDNVLLYTDELYFEVLEAVPVVEETQKESQNFTNQLLILLAILAIIVVFTLAYFLLRREDKDGADTGETEKEDISSGSTDVRETDTSLSNDRVPEEGPSNEPDQPTSVK